MERLAVGHARAGSHLHILSESEYTVNTQLVTERLMVALVSGDREEAQSIILSTVDEGLSPQLLIAEVLWPAYETVEKLFRSDQMTTLAHHLATRLLRVLQDQAAIRLERQASIGRSVFAVCGPTDADELAAQMAVDLLEHHGFDIRYAGGGIATDEILAHVQHSQPDVLLLFASAPQDLPGIRGLIDTLNEIGAVRKLQVVVGGGVFNRADGLAEEIGADLWATDPLELVEDMVAEPERRATPDQHTVGRKRALGMKAA